MRRVVRSGGFVVITTRDDDAVVAERPTTAPVQRSLIDDLRVVATAAVGLARRSARLRRQPPADPRDSPGHWATAARTTTYRASWPHADTRWIAPEDSGFFQPIMFARASCGVRRR
jgi:hypothetical protein